MPATAVRYLTVKADDRQELRLPAILKKHAARVAEKMEQAQAWALRKGVELPCWGAADPLCHGSLERMI